jgi:hypothetical protein
MLDLLNKYPKAAEVVKNWFTDKMIESLNTDDVPEDFKEMIRQDVIDNEKLDKILGKQPRTLFDVFDEHKIYIEIQLNTGSSVKFLYLINKNQTSFEQYNTRKEAEGFAVETAFEILEQKLSEDEVTVEV